MTVSNSNDFTQTRNQLITNALYALGVYRPGATVSTNDLNVCSDYLNMMVKAWNAKGIHMWSEAEGTLFLRNGVTKYTVSSSSNDKSGDDVVETTLSASASSTTLTVVSSVGMTAADVIGIELDDNTRQWTTIVSVDSTTQVTITTSLTSTASSGNTVFSYTIACGKPIQVKNIVFRDSSNTDKPVFKYNRDQYLDIPNKTTTGSSIQYVCFATKRTDSTFYVWPTPDNVKGRLKFNYARMLFDFDNGTDTPDFPSEWLESIWLNLAVLVAPIYGKVGNMIADLKQTADRSLLEMQLWDVDGGSVRIVPNADDE